MFDRKHILILFVMGFGIPAYVLFARFVTQKSSPNISSIKEIFHDENTNNINESISSQPDLLDKPSEKTNEDIENKNQTSQISESQCDCERRCIYASKRAVESLAFVTSTINSKTIQRDADPFEDLFERFFGFSQGQRFKREYKTQPVRGQGSGVVIAPDGYIVTNNHVIDQADKIEIILSNNRKYEAKLVGTDPNTDIALLKIEDKDLPYLTFGDSDSLEVGQTVISVGNALSFLNSTVTKGIVSAKARDFHKYSESLSISSFIQTDAAMNSGCSGGGLLDLNANLIGINVAITPTQTNSFMGYSYAVPSNIAKKVVSDIMKYGYVQRIVLGIKNYCDIDDEIVKKNKLKKYKGCLVLDVVKDSVADKAGIKKNDVIIALNDQLIESAARFYELALQCPPESLVKITIDRFGTTKEFTVKPQAPNYIPIKKNKDSLTVNGATFKLVDSNLKKKLEEVGINACVQISDVFDTPWKGIFKKGYIVISINDVEITSLDQIQDIISKKRGVFTFDGVYPDNLDNKICYAIRLGR